MRQLLKQTYDRVYGLLPQKGKVHMSELVFKFANKPYVYFDGARHPSHRLHRGAVAFSFDFEMAWAWQYARNQHENCVTAGLREREQVPQILTVLEGFGIPATWATVGHLFLTGCSRGAGGLAHPDMPRPPHFASEYWNFTSGDWYQNDPCSDYRRDPAWYAPDLVEAILSAKAGHEIACHGFSHAGYGAYCPQVVAEAELEASIAAMHKFGVRPRTMVFPGNDEGHYAVLAAKGFRAVRAFAESWAEISLPIRRDDGLWGIHDSASVDLEGEGWSIEERLSRLKKYVDKAASERMAAHFWLHPSLQPEQMRGLLFPLVKYCADQREKGLIEVFTLAGLVEATAVALHKEDHNDPSVQAFIRRGRTRSPA